MTVAAKAHELLFGQDEMVSAWVSDRQPEGQGNHGGSPCTAIGVKSNGRLIAGVTYYDYYPEHRTMQLGIASISPMWARRDTITALLSYPFMQLDVFKCWILVSAGNEKCLKAVNHIGFNEEGVLKHQFGVYNDGVFLSMLKPDYLRLYV